MPYRSFHCRQSQVISIGSKPSFKTRSSKTFTGQIRSLRHKDFEGGTIFYIAISASAFPRACKTTYWRAIAGNQRATKTQNLRKRRYYLSTVKSDMEEHLRYCEICQKQKQSLRFGVGKLQPLPVPDEKLKHISMDFIANLPLTSEGYDTIFGIIDRCTKYARFIPTTMNVTAQIAARLFLNHWVRFAGLPVDLYPIEIHASQASSGKG
mmetsp:Transcript_24485/g.35336  ORF Transcript_24485/g.35336 Transcript_24485/m.35336 type:complete len:209 (+) Transcript_24485:724-1350(+)